MPFSGLFFCVGVFYWKQISLAQFILYGILELNLYIGITLSDYKVPHRLGKCKMENWLK